MLIPGQDSAFHGHEGSECFVKVLQVNLIEQQVPYSNQTSPISSLSQKTLSENDDTYIDDSIGLHKVTNNSLSPAITPDIYLPAHKKARIFDAQNISLDRSQVIDVTYQSESGIRALTKIHN